MLPFAKYHGLGNDFLIVDLRAGEPVPSPNTPNAARALCDRRFGVGGDGVLAILPAAAPHADCRMRVLNADGSEAEMCGNGIRCVAKHLHDRDPALRRHEIRIETLAGVLACGITTDAAGVATDVAVRMGHPRLSRGEIPMSGPAVEHCLEQTFAIDGAPLAITAVSMGNPHAVTFVEKGGPALRALAERLGPTLEKHPAFPRRTNAEFAHVLGENDLELVVWERGCGITLACGTGACATAVAACLTGRARVDEEITVRLLGGPLAITVAHDYSQVTMRGPATLVYDGLIDLGALLA